MTWLYLGLAIVFEVGWAVSMKASPGLSLSWGTARTLVLYLLSLVFLTLVVRKMDVAVAYAIWAGLGIGLIALIGVWKFEEPWNAVKTVSLGLILIGVVGIHLADRGAHPRRSQQSPSAATEPR